MLEPLIQHGDDLRLSVEKETTEGGLQITFHLKSNRPYLLHWGLARQRSGPWEPPPRSLWPGGTNQFSETAVQTPFADVNGERKAVLRVGDDVKPPFLVFDLFCPETKRWENNHGKDFYLPIAETAAPPAASLAPTGPPPGDVLKREIQNADVLHKTILPIDGGGELAAAVTRTNDGFQLLLLTNIAGPLALHWGTSANTRSPWRLPAPEIRPPATTVVNELAVETPFNEWQELRRLTFDFTEANLPAGISFVLHQTETNRWLKHRGQNIFIPLLPKPQSATGTLSPMTGRIVEGEMGEHGWTLMHRFNLAHELIDEAGDSREGWATIFVWLRYSAIRQLDWQRNYNTKPRELSHSQDRLTGKLASSWIHKRPHRDFIRLALTCVGRGGEGQRIRDEILQIMHRHHIKEVGGTWMEQWHQKLHNNTTPDDVVICEAYLAFLHSDGNLDRYFETLGAGGVTKERLAAFERPITNNPEFHGHLKGGLIWDFENYLKLLKSVHSATDLDTAANTIGHLLDGSARDALVFARQNFSNTNASVGDLVRSITHVRQNLCAKLNNEGDAGRVREMLYLDCALEDALRMVIERSIGSTSDGDRLVELVQLVLENLRLTHDSAELAQCHNEWQRLPQDKRFGTDWSLHAKATTDRLRRAVADGIDRAYQELQPVAEQLGSAFNADEWAVKLFSEEVVRGRPAFVLSLLLRHLDPLLRRAAKLGDWQVISPSLAIGRVEAVESLREIQSKRFEQPTVIVAEKVHGDEEPPEGVCAVITPSSVDLVSHVAVRARNAQLLFATCYDRAVFERLKAMKDRVVQLRVTLAGDVLFDEAIATTPTEKRSRSAAPTIAVRTKASAKPIRRSEFEPGLVGGKSNNLKLLAAKLPDWIHAPRSVALPFGTFDEVLKDGMNRNVAARYCDLRSALERGLQSASLTDAKDALTLPATGKSAGGSGLKPALPSAPAHNLEVTLANIRQCLLDVQIPESLQSDLHRAMQSEGLPAPDDWPLATQRIKQVWASKWNDRAFFSRQANRLPHDSVNMAVLIQEIVPAEYAFVIHTINPFNGNRDEIYAEVVLGLGETLVGNHPGRALSFIANKADAKITVLGYPSKSIGLYGTGLIFRSDSNAEDLEGYAGAGLYDSVLLQPPREVTVDYATSPLVWDEKFRAELLTKIARVGLAVEKAFGSPQDIEGAFVGGKFSVVQTRPQVGL